MPDGRPGKDTDGGFRQRYDDLGVPDYYRQAGSSYRNPHEAAVRAAVAAAVDRWQPDLSRILDLACGSGEVTLALRDLGCAAVVGVDPFTGDAYRERTGLEAGVLSFEDIAGGALADERFSLIVCSYALHLLDTSRLPGLLTQLALLAPDLVVITPHKRPHVDAAWGWQLADELMVERTRARIYRSRLAAPSP